MDTDSTSEAAPEMPTVIVEPVIKDDVEIFGEYVGRIRAQQFVEVRDQGRRLSGKHAFCRRHLCK